MYVGGRIQLIFEYPGLQLAKLEGKNGEQFTLELTMMISMDKEGDSTILFRNSEGIPLAELTFTLCEYQGKRTMFIGGLQGAKWEIPHQEIQNATKACHGLFPKRLVMEAACLFAQRLQVEQIIAVSNETHIYRSLRYRDKEGKIHADYNAFWESVGGVCDAERHYRLPAQIARKEIAEIASKKRAEYRRRYEMLDAIQPQMARCFVVSRPDRAPATARVRTFFQQRRYGVHTTTSGLHCHFNGKIGFGRAMDRFRDNFAQIHRYIFRDLRHAVEHIGKSLAIHKMFHIQRR